LQKTSFREVEESIGLFDIALSFSSDCNKQSSILARTAKFRGLKCYDYRDYSADQFGINIFDIMSFVYSNTDRIVILNSPEYRLTRATKFEFDTISNNSLLQNISVFQLGGPSLDLAPKKFQEIHSFGDPEILSVTHPA